MSKKEITQLPDNFMEAFDATVTRHGVERPVEKANIAVLEQRLSQVNAQLRAARMGGTGNIKKLNEQRHVLVEELASARRGDKFNNEPMPKVDETEKEDGSKSKAPARKGDQSNSEPMPKLKEGLDPVGKEDGDVDNDGDVDKSDEYLKKRRAAIAKAVKEDIEHAKELSLKEGARWEYTDARGVKKKGTFVKSISGQGTDVTYQFKGDDGKTDMVSGSRLKQAKRLNEEVELDEANLTGNYAEVEYDYKEDFWSIEVYKNGKKVAKENGYFGANATGNPLVKKFVEMVKKAGLKPEGLKIVSDWEDHMEGVFKNNTFKWNVKEEVELDEAKSAIGYTINHKTFSSAVQHAKDQVEKQGYTIDDDEWDRKVAMGPKKPGTGKTNRYTIALMKNGKETRRNLQMQVYYDEGRYELNMYIS